MIKTIPVSTVIILILVSYSSCVKKNKYDDSLIFRMNRYDNISSLDPAFARTQANNWACNLMYNSLVKYDDSLNIQPDIAKEWQISPDAKTYTFLIQKNIYFHPHPNFGKDSTRAVTAHDFVFSFNRLTNPAVGGSGSWVMNNVASYQALNDSVFQIQLKESFPPFLGLLSTKYCSVVPKEMFTQSTKAFDANHPIGTGPFRFKYWENGVKLVLRKNPLYFLKDNQGNQLPYLESVAISFLPEKYSAFLQLVQGKLDMLADLDPSYKDEILTPTGNLNPKYQQQINMQKSPYLSTVYFCFYLDDSKPIDLKLRKAINHGINKEKMITYFMNGVGKAANGGFVPDGLPGYSSKNGYDYNPTKAKQLIEQYKQLHGSLPEITLTTVQEYTDIAEFTQSQMIKLGLKINVNVVPGPTMRDGKANGKFSFFRANWGADYPDAENFLSLYYSKNLAPEGPNYSHYQHPTFDEWYQQSFTIVNPQERAKLYQKMDSLMMQSAPIVPVLYDQTVVFLNKNVQGFNMSPIKLLDLTKVKKIKP